MIVNVYSVFDCKAHIWMPPFTFRTDAEAIRALTNTANDPNSSMGQHPADFALYRIGKFDDASGEVIAESEKKALGLAVEFIRPTESADIFET